MRQMLGGLLALCLMQSACSNPRQPDLTALLSPAGSDSCAEQVSVGSGIVHVLSVVHASGQTASACATAEGVLTPLSSSPKSEPAQAIRGTLKCQLVRYPAGKSSDQIIKVYVFSDGSADSEVKKVCDHLQATADPSSDFQNM